MPGHGHGQMGCIAFAWIHLLGCWCQQPQQPQQSASILAALSVFGHTAMCLCMSAYHSHCFWIHFKAYLFTECVFGVWRPYPSFLAWYTIDRKNTTAATTEYYIGVVDVFVCDRNGMLPCMCLYATGQRPSYCIALARWGGSRRCVMHELLDRLDG